MLSAERRAELLRLGATVVVGSLLIGAVGALFRWSLERASDALASLVQWARHWSDLGWCVPLAVVAACVALARWLVRLVPSASGSGVQLVEAVARGDTRPPPLAVLPVKFLGGWLAIGSGLALGREGPTIQMGATIGQGAARILRLGPADARDVQTAIAGAGLAVAFNAPLGGALFVFEEVSRSFRLRLAIATLLSVCIAVNVSRHLLGNHVEFQIFALALPSFWTLIPYFVFGVLVGVLGAAYSRATLLGLDLFERFGRWPPEARAGIVGAIVGLIAWFEPTLVGGGEALNQRVLDGGLSLSALGVIFAVRWFLGPLSYSAGTPGGLFAPLLLVGAAFGAWFGELLQQAWPSVSVEPTAFALVGMAAFFAAVVRAPFIGILLVVEMTATTAMVVPLLAACFAAVVTATLVGTPAIYDSLRERMLVADAEGGHSGEREASPARRQ